MGAPGGPALAMSNLLLGMRAWREWGQTSQVRVLLMGAAGGPLRTYGVSDKADTFDWDVHPYATAGKHPSHTHACDNTVKTQTR